MIALALWSSAAPGQDIDEGTETYIRANTIFFFYHELGHAMIDLMRLPVFGQEEDAADVLGVVLAETINHEDDTETIMLATADNFAYMAETAKEDGYELAFWDTHDLDEQRFFTILCLYFGADPDNRLDVAEEWVLPDERRASCEEERQLADDSWGPVIDDLGDSNGSEWLDLVVASEPMTVGQEIVADAVVIEVQLLNELFQPDFTVRVLVEECQEANAFYDPNVGEIAICTELAQLFTE